MLKRLRPTSEFARNVITLMTGTTIAQAIPIAISPILTRLYTPEDFGVFALYMAIVSIASVLATGRYELAIMLPKNDTNAINVLALSVLLTCAISFTLLAISYLFKFEITEMIGAPSIASWLYFIPLSVFLTAVYQSLNYWVNRKANYKRMSISRVVQNGGISFGQLGGGYAMLNIAGLVYGQLIGQVLATFFLLKQISKEEGRYIKKINKMKIYVMAVRYKSFPKFLIVAHSLNRASAQMPVLIVNTLFNPVVAGLYVLTQRVFGAPLSLVANSIGDVFREKASRAYAINGECRNIYKQTFVKLFLLSIVPTIIFLIIAPEFFALIFGEPWREAGVFSQIMTPMFLLRFITSPLSQMSIIAQANKYDLYWQLALFFLTTLALYLGYLWKDIYWSLAFYSAVYCLMYSVDLVVTYWLAKGKKLVFSP